MSQFIAHSGLTVPTLELGLQLFQEALQLPVVFGPIEVDAAAFPFQEFKGFQLSEGMKANIAFVELPNGHRVELVATAPSQPIDSPPGKRYPFTPGSWHIGIKVPDMDAAIARILSLKHWNFEKLCEKPVDLPAQAGEALHLMFLVSRGDESIKGLENCCLELFADPVPSQN